MNPMEHQEHSHLAGETPEETRGHGPHKVVRFLVIALIVYALLPAFGVGLYSNASGDRFFTLWYLLVFLVLGFFLMHEVITPLPPKDEKR